MHRSLDATRLAFTGQMARGAPDRHATGRICADPNCGTVLSIYNPSSVCFRHHQPEPAKPGRSVRTPS
jgi:hypothetical protein